MTFDNVSIQVETLATEALLDTVKNQGRDCISQRGFNADFNADIVLSR